MAPRWLPLESNPEVINKYLDKLGVSTSSWSFYDVYGLDIELLAMVPSPAIALVLLFPISKNYENHRKEENERIAKDGQHLCDGLYYTKQTVGNACGTVAVIHSIANNTDKITLAADSPLKAFLDRSCNATPEEKAKMLEDDQGLAECHSGSAQEGQTKAPSVDEKVDLHFIAFVQKDGHLYELDGRKSFPINHGVSSPDTFLQDAALASKKFMERDPTLTQFNIMALSKTEQ